MYRLILEEAIARLQAGEEAAREGVRDAGALLHHVAQLPCLVGTDIDSGKDD